MNIHVRYCETQGIFDKRFKQSRITTICVLGRIAHTYCSHQTLMFYQCTIVLKTRNTKYTYAYGFLLTTRPRKRFKGDVIASVGNANAINTCA